MNRAANSSQLSFDQPRRGSSVRSVWEAQGTRLLPVQPNLERIPSLFRFPDNRSSISRDDSPQMSPEGATADRDASPLRTTSHDFASDKVELFARVKSLEAENEVLRHRAAQSTLVSSQHMKRLAQALEEAEMERDAAQVALVREKERCFLLQQRVSLLEAMQTRPAAALTEGHTMAGASTLHHAEIVRVAHPRHSSFDVSIPPSPPPSGDNDYILTALRPASRSAAAESIGSQQSGYSHAAARTSFRLTRSFPSDRRMPATPNPTISLFSQHDLSHASSLVGAALRGRESGDDRLASVLRGHTPSVGDCRPPLRPDTQQADTSAHGRPRSQRFRSPLFGTPSSPHATGAHHA